MELFSFAALWTRTRIDDELVQSATMLITEANAVAARVLNRMPVILPGPEEEEVWLNGDLDDALELLRPLDPDRMDLAPANPALNKVGGTGRGRSLWSRQPDFSGIHGRRLAASAFRAADPCRS